MRQKRNFLLVLLTGLFVFVSCSTEEDVIPSDAQQVLLKSKNNGLLDKVLKFDAIHNAVGQFLVMIPPEFIGNRVKFSAGVITAFTGEVPEMLRDSEIIATLTAFWKLPAPDPNLIMMGAGPAKGEFTIEREGKVIWNGTITGVRKNIGTEENPLFQWKGHVKADGVGEYEGLKLTATETTDPSPYPAVTYYWSGVITP